jgi:hypothetical protein
MTKLSITEETIEMLPSRETLSWGSSFHFGDNLAVVLASNSSTAGNVNTIGGLAFSVASQTINVTQK